VIDVDQVFPFVTSGSSSGAPSNAGDQTPGVSAALRDVLGWRPRAQDTKAFVAALTASFRLEEVEGHVETTYLPRGFAIQADLGAVSGGQASLYSRGRSAHEQINRLLDGMVPLRTDADHDDCNAFLSLVRHGIDRLIDELGNPGGPRQPLIDNSFDMLAGALLPPGPYVSNTHADRVAALSGTTADTVLGQLAAMRDRFGLIDANVNNVDEEKIRTSFWTLVDLVIDLRRSWEEWKFFLDSGQGVGFLGTDLVVISRLMAAAAEQVYELESILDSVLITASERQTLTFTTGNTSTGLTLDGLLSWLKVFLTEDGPMYARDSGRDGMLSAFAPTAEKLLAAVRENLINPVGSIERQQGDCCPVELIPTECCQSLPAGMYAARVRIAVASLCRLLCELFNQASKISRYPGIVLFDVQFQRVLGFSVGGEPAVRVSIRGANLRPTYVPVFALTDDYDLLPFRDSVTTDNDTLVAIFPLPVKEKIIGVLTTIFGEGVNLNQEFTVAAQFLPLRIEDGLTGRLIKAPPTRVWPSLKVPTTGFRIRSSGLSGMATRGSVGP